MLVDWVAAQSSVFLPERSFGPRVKPVRLAKPVSGTASQAEPRIVCALASESRERDMKRILSVVFAGLVAASAHGATQEAEIKAVETYCKADVERLCKGVKFGGGALKSCLKTNEKELSVGCAEALKSLKEG